MQATSTAVVFESPGHLALRAVSLPACDPGDCLVDIEWTGISTGTERLLWDGRMPAFPGLGYPLVPGYESVGTVVEAGPDSVVQPGQRVFVPGSRGFTDVRGLFGGAAERLVVASDRVIPLTNIDSEQGVLLALAATALHAINRLNGTLPDLIVGHGVLGMLLARITVARGGNPMVWEKASARLHQHTDYTVCHPDEDSESHYQTVVDVTGDADLLDSLIARLAPRGTLLLAGFYHEPIHFLFAPAFMREISLLIAAEWKPEDMQQTLTLVEQGSLSLAGLITHRYQARDAAQAYTTAFTDPNCLKLVLDWRQS